MSCNGVNSWEGEAPAEPSLSNEHKAARQEPRPPKWMSIALIVFSILAFFVHQTLAAPRNVLLMISDDQGLDGGCFGNPAVHTPHLDKFASQSTRFANGFAAVSSCSPSRATMLTGLFNHTNGQYGLAHGAHNQVTEDWVKSLPKLLNDRGYRTALIGKNHVRPESVYPYQTEITPNEISGRSVAEMANKAAEIFSADDAKPFFLVMGFQDPHRAGKGFANKEYPGVKRNHYDPANVRVPAFLPDVEAVRKDLADYYESIDRLDQGVGLTLDALDKSGKRDNTLVLFVSDNGMPFPGAKTNLYDAGIRQPYIVQKPGQKRGVVSAAMVSFIDLAPTILEWTDTKAPYPLPGRSLLPIVDDANPKGWDTIVASNTFHEITMYYPMRALRTHTHKLILNLAHQLPYPIAADISAGDSAIAVEKSKSMGKRDYNAYLHRSEIELYDLEKDPDEFKNVADDPAYASVKSDLLQQLRNKLRETKDPWLEQFPK